MNRLIKLPAICTHLSNRWIYQRYAGVNQYGRLPHYPAERHEPVDRPVLLRGLRPRPVSYKTGSRYGSGKKLNRLESALRTARLLARNPDLKK